MTFFCINNAKRHFQTQHGTPCACLADRVVGPSTDLYCCGGPCWGVLEDMTDRTSQGSLLTPVASFLTGALVMYFLSSRRFRCEEQGTSCVQGSTVGSTTSFTAVTPSGCTDHEACPSARQPFREKRTERQRVCRSVAVYGVDLPCGRQIVAEECAGTQGDSM